MRKYFLILPLLILSCQINAQNYTQLTDSALHLMWKAKDTVAKRNALNLYEQAFKRYPSEIENTGRYKAAVLSAGLLEIDKAFEYLGPVAKSDTESDHGWENILDYGDEYKSLHEDPRWKKLVSAAQIDKKVFLEKIAHRQAEFERGGLRTIIFAKKDGGEATYQKIKNFNLFLKKKEEGYSIKFKVTDSLNTSYFVRLPKNYNPKKSYSILFFLHGAVAYNGFSEYQDSSVGDDWNRYYTKYAALHDVIMVYPSGSKKYNWMIPDDGFFMVPAMLREIKQSVNIDDNKIFITGHSNGATGSFSYLMKQQSPFAGFYGFNTQPKVRTGGTFIRNILNRSYFNVSTDQDYYYPPGANDTLNVLMKKLGADYLDHRFNGFPHWFPQFDESEAVYPLLFKDLAARKRNPFHSQIYWECDDVKYGKADWLEITQLDTAAKSADWHQQINFDILKLLVFDKNDSLVSKDTLTRAFKFPRRPGAVKGYFKNNEFHLQTSAVKNLTVYISPEMVDMAKPVIIYINGIKKAGKKPAYNKSFIIDNFNRTYDRKAVWVDRIDITI